ncbi:MAG: glycosyl hydrolase [Clostridia bacterium]|nr:glycosyl hydrolase [Clostridia bacterium]
MKKSLLIFAVLILTLALLVSCDGGKTEGNKGNEGNQGNTDGKIVLQTISDISEYKIVREDTFDDTAKKLSVTLRDAISKATGTNVGIVTDASGKKAKEILIGNTNRAESQEKKANLLYGEFFIGIVNEKIVIVGESNDSLTDAVDYFIQKFIKEDSKSLKVPSGVGYHKKGVYSVRELTVEGTPISEFHLYTDARMLDKEKMTESIRSTLAGSAISFAKNMKEGNHYIVIDNSSFDYTGYSYEIKDGNIYIKGSFSRIYEVAELLGKEYLASKKADKYDLTSADNYKGELPKKDYYTKDQLMKVLTDVYEDPNKIIIGQQATSTGVGRTIQLFEEATGEKPAMVGFDTTSYGFDLMTSSDEAISEQICLTIEYVEAGGIFNISAHFSNPSGNIPSGEWQEPRGTLGAFSSVAEYEKAFADLITPGTEYNKNFMKEVEKTGKFMKALDDAGIAVLYRPFHEMNGYWFWWCVGQGKNYVSAESYTNLWKYVYNYYVNECGIDNMLWVYAPDMQSAVANSGPGSYEKQFSMPTPYCYPGDDYCDIVGVDWYTNQKEGLEITHNDSYLDLIDAVNKAGAITEWGPRGKVQRNEIYAETGQLVEQITLYNALDLYANLVTLRDKGYSFSYLLTWHNHWSIPQLGHGDKFMEKDMPIGLAEVAAMFEALK